MAYGLARLGNIALRDCLNVVWFFRRKESGGGGVNSLGLNVVYLQVNEKKTNELQRGYVHIQIKLKPILSDCDLISSFASRLVVSAGVM